MNYINSIYIKKLFEGLNNSGVVYALIKNVGKELPYNLMSGKDIDIIVHKDSMCQFHEYMDKIGRKIIHPLGKEYGWENLYGLDEFEFWRLNTFDDIYIDVTNKLCCHSLMPKKWIPLDNIIQMDLWKNKIFDINNNWWRMDDDVLFVYLVIRCVFDKKYFSPTYKSEIQNQLKSINEEIVVKYLRVVFFNFTEKLMLMLKNEEYDSIFNSYIKFREY